MDEAGRARLGIDRPPVQRPPAPVGDARRVRDQHVRVDLRVAGATRPMLERRAHEASSGHDLEAAGAAARPARVPFEVAERLGDRGALRVEDGLLDVGGTDPEEDRRALRDGEHEVEARHARALDRALEEPPGARIALRQDRAQRLLRHVAPQTEAAGGAAAPLADRLRAGQVVVLRAGGDALGVIDPPLRLVEEVALV